MMNAQNIKVALLLAAGLTLTGCGGDDGEDGQPGQPGGSPAGSVTDLNFTFNNVLINNGIPSVDFTVTNEEDLPVVGLQKLRFYAEQLIPEGATGAGNASQWEYLVDETCDLSTNACPGTFVDHKNGQYSFTFSKNLTSSTTGSYKADLAQRLVIRNYNVPLADGTPIPEETAIKDYMGNSGADATYTRKIVTTESCNACHNDIHEVGHQTSDVSFCASCHTPGKVGEGKEFNTFIHDIHFEIADNEIKPASNAAALESCAACHSQNEATPEWQNWSRIPTAASCGSCHNNIDFAAGNGHPQQLDNSNCIACHNSEWTESLHNAKSDELKTIIAKVGMEATLTPQADKTAVLAVTMLDAQGQAIKVNSILSKIKNIETITNVGPNFPVMGYGGNPITGEKKVLKFLVKNGVLEEGVTIVDGKITFTTPVLPFGTGDAGTAFTFLGLEVCVNGSELVDCTNRPTDTTVGMKAELALGTIEGQTPSTRHTDSINFTACATCHGDSFQLHEAYHTGFVMTEQLGRQDANGKMVVGVDACVACHTPDGTYATSTTGAFEMKVHAYHNAIVTDGVPDHGEPTEFKIINDCAQCHNAFNLESFKVKGALATSAAPSERDAKYTTPITAVCTSCHTPESIGHGLEQMGAVVDGDYTKANQAAQAETCFYCHTPTVADHTAVKM